MRWDEARKMGCFRVPLLIWWATLFYSVGGFSWSSQAMRDDKLLSSRSDDILRRYNSSLFFGDLMLQDEPQPSTGIQEKVVVRGQVVILECLEKIKSRKFIPKLKDTHPDAAVRWYHDKEEVKPDLRVTWSVIGILRISHAISVDSGVWRCRKDGYYRRPLRLVVTIPPERPFIVFVAAQLAEGARLTTRTGNALTLHCVVKGGNPAPSIAWFLNEKEITANSTTHNEWLGPQDQFTSISNVTIDKIVKSHHNASVVCRVLHPALSRPYTSHLRLNIEYPPDFRLRRWPTWGSPLIAGSSVTIFCNVDSNPPSSPAWIKTESNGEEENLPSIEGWLNITSLSAMSRGWYKCVTNHAFGHFSSHSVFINVLPHVISKSKEADIVGASRVGDITPSHEYLGRVSPSHTVVLDSGVPCTKSGAGSTLCWSGGITQEKEQMKNQLQQSQSEQQPNSVECPSNTNEKSSSDSQSDFIWKSGMKIKVMNRTHVSSEGSPAMLTVHICGREVIADQVTWLPPSKHVPIKPGSSYRWWTAFSLSSPDSQKCVLSNLHIKSVVAARDAGMWVILITNSFSAHAAVVQLNVTSAAKSLATATADSTAGSSSQAFNSILLFGVTIIYLIKYLHLCR